MKNIFFKGILKGSEILKMNPNLIGLENEVLYHYTQGEKIYGDKIECELHKMITEEEQVSIDEAKRVKKLTDIIIEKQLYNGDATEEQAELKSLRENTYGDYIKNVEQVAIDDFTMDLILSGVI